MDTLIEMHNIRKEYRVGDQQVHALDGVDFTVRQGETVAILGPSGSGKSTLMNLLGCLDTPDAGEYRLAGQAVERMTEGQLSRIRGETVGFVFQGFNLISRTSALENVDLPMVYNHTPASKRREKAMQALEAVGLAQRAHHMPNQLSGGQQQRVAIARSLVCDAPIIFADEPTGNLDTKMSIEVMELFTRLNKEMGKTIILITHEPDIAEYAGRLITFRDGKKVSDEVKK